MRINKAFTLIEVLVALLIIAIACAAVIRAMTQGVRTTSHLQSAIVSRWVATNVLAELQNGLLPSLRQNAEQNGVIKMWNRRWLWRASSVQDATDNYYMQVQIAVGDATTKKQAYQLTGFVWDPVVTSVNAS